MKKHTHYCLDKTEALDLRGCFYLNGGYEVSEVAEITPGVWAFWTVLND